MKNLPHTLFCFSNYWTTYKILPTIISGIQDLILKKVEDTDIVTRLEYVLKLENKEYQTPAGTCCK